MNGERGVRIAAAERFRLAYESELGDIGAFLPGRVPLDRLPPPLQPYLNAADDLARHYPKDLGGVRGWLDPLFGEPRPECVALLPALSEPERQRLMTVLSVLAHAYRWDSVPPAEDRFTEHRIPLPAGLREPWWRLAELLGQPAVGTTWGMLLGNWRMTDRAGGARYRPEELTPGNLRVAHQWLLPPHDEHLQRFSLTWVLVEAAGAGALRALVEVVEACAAQDRAGAQVAMADLHRGVRAVATAFTSNVRAARIDPGSWLELVQPTFAWAAATPDGTAEGASGMQLGTIQSLDAVLGVLDDSDFAAQTRRARRYLPPAHRRFLEAADDVRHVVGEFVAATTDDDLTQRFNACVKALASFRLAHVTRGARYLSAGRSGESPRVSTGLGTPWRPDQHTTTASPDDGGDPVEHFRQQMSERLRETRAAALGVVPSDGDAGAGAEAHHASSGAEAP